LAFENNVEYTRGRSFLSHRKIAGKVARFRQIDTREPHVHHDALEFPDGQIARVNDLREGQRATVLQLPVSPRSVSNAVKQNDRVVVF
jgi:hypothetical protein